MKKIRFNRSVLVPKVGAFNKDQAYRCSNDYARFLVEKKKYAEYTASGSKEKKLKTDKKV